MPLSAIGASGLVAGIAGTSEALYIAGIAGFDLSVFAEIPGTFVLGDGRVAGEGLRGSNPPCDLSPYGALSSLEVDFPSRFDQSSKRLC